MKEEVLGGYPTSIKTAIEMREWSIVAQFIECPAIERGAIVRRSIDLAIRWWDEHSALRLLELYRHTAFDVCLAHCLRREGFTHRADCPPNGYAIDRYEEYFIKPVLDPDWRKKVDTEIAANMANILLSLPSAGDSVSLVSSIQPAFPELKKALIGQILAHSAPTYTASIVVKLRANVWHEEIKKLYRDIARSISDACNLEACNLAIATILGSLGSEINPGIKELLLRSLLIRKIMLSDPNMLSAIALAKAG